VIVFAHKAHTLKNDIGSVFGVEIGVRDSQGAPRLSYRPIVGDHSVGLLDWVSRYPSYGMYALNIRSDGNERTITNIMNSTVGRDRWFAFNMSFPCRFNYNAWHGNIVDRYSDLEEDINPYSTNCGVWSDRWVWNKREANDLMISKMPSSNSDGRVPHYYVSPELHLGANVKKWKIGNESYLHAHWAMVKDDSHFVGICTDFYEEAREFFK
jgi:hypothetical protein